MHRLLAGLTLIAAAVALPTAAHADTYLCMSKSGETLFTNKKRMKGMRCKLWSKAPPQRSAPNPEPNLEPTTAPAPPPAPHVVAGTAHAPAPAPAPRPQIQYIPVPVYNTTPGLSATTGPVIEEHRPRLAPADEPRDRAGREQMYLAYVEEAAELYQLPEAFLMALIRTESDFTYRKRDKAADKLGLMGLTGALAADLGVTDRFDPRASVLGGARRARQLANLHSGDIPSVLAHWLSGEALADGAVMSEPTREAVRTVLDYYYAYQSAAQLEGGIE